MSADGNWKLTINTPLGVQTLTAAVVTSGDTFTAKIESPMGDQDVSGKVAGNTLVWSAAITKPMPMTLEFDAVVDGDKMTGNVKLGAFGVTALTGERV